MNTNFRSLFPPIIEALRHFDSMRELCGLDRSTYFQVAIVRLNEVGIQDQLKEHVGIFSSLILRACTAAAMVPHPSARTALLAIAADLDDETDVFSDGPAADLFEFLFDDLIEAVTAAEIRMLMEAEGDQFHPKILALASEISRLAA